VFPASPREGGAGAHPRASSGDAAVRGLLDAALTNVGPVIHPPLVLVNAASIDGGRFDVHAAGTSPSARKLIDAVDAQRVAARHGLGYPPPHYDMATTYYDEARASEDSTAPAPRPS